MKELKLKYKRETGNSAMLETIESEFMTNPYNDFSTVLCDFTKKEILEIISNETTFCGVKMEEVPSKFIEDENLILPAPGYIEWLEEKVTELEKNKTKCKKNNN